MAASRGRRVTPSPHPQQSTLLLSSCNLQLLLVAVLLTVTPVSYCQEIDTGAGVLGVDPPIFEAAIGDEGVENATEIVLTGNPQIDYVHDPNLPHELIGYDLSDYPFYKRVPAKGHNFTCDGRLDGFYASVPHKCQVYYNCLFGQRYDFLCANYTVFDQANFICHYASEVDCKSSEKYFDRNEELYVTTTTTTKAPRVVYVDRPRRPRPRPLPGIKVRRPQINRKRRPSAAAAQEVQVEDQEQQAAPAEVDYYDDYYYDDYYYDYPEATTSTTTTTTTARPLRRRGGNRPGGGRRPGPGRRRRPRPRQGGGPRRKRIRSTTTTTTAAPDYPEYYYDDYYDDYYNDYADDPKPTTTTTTTTQAPKPQTSRVRKRPNRRPNFRRAQTASEPPAAALQEEEPVAKPARRNRVEAQAVEEDTLPVPQRRRVVAKPINSRGEIGGQDYDIAAELDDPAAVQDEAAHASPNVDRQPNRRQRLRPGGRRQAGGGAQNNRETPEEPVDEQPPRRRPGFGFGGRRP